MSLHPDLSYENNCLELELKTRVIYFYDNMLRKIKLGTLTKMTVKELEKIVRKQK